MTRDPSEVLIEAATLYKGRDDEYGSFVETQELVADIATNLLGFNFSAHQVQMVLMAVKLARLSRNPGHQGSYVDLINYTAFASALAPAAGLKSPPPEPEPAKPAPRGLQDYQNRPALPPAPTLPNGSAS